MDADRFLTYVSLGILAASLAAAYHFAGCLLLLAARGVRWLAVRTLHALERS